MKADQGKMTEFLSEGDEVLKAFQAIENNLEGAGVKLADVQYQLGALLLIDAKTERFDAELKAANALLTREYRKGYEVPEMV